MLKSSPGNRDIYLQPHIDTAFSRSNGHPISQQQERLICRDCKDQRVICRDCRDQSQQCDLYDQPHAQKNNLHTSPYQAKPYTLLAGKHFQTPALLASEDELSRDNYEGVNSADSLEFTDRDSVRKNIYFQAQPGQYDNNRNGEGLKVSPIKRAMVSDQESIENPKKMFGETFERDPHSLEQGYENTDMSKEYFDKFDRINNNFSGVIQRDFSTAAGDIVQHQAVKDSLLEQENMIPAYNGRYREQRQDTTREAEKWKTAATTQDAETNGSYKESKYTTQSPSRQQYDSPAELESKNPYRNESKAQQNVGRSALAFKDITRHLRKEKEEQKPMPKQRTLLSSGKNAEPARTKENNQNYLNLEGRRADTYTSNEQSFQGNRNGDERIKISHKLQAKEYPLEKVVSYEASNVEGKQRLDPVELPLQVENNQSRKKILVQESENYGAEKESHKPTASTDYSLIKQPVKHERVPTEVSKPSGRVLGLQNEILSLIKSKRIEEALSRIEDCSNIIEEDFEEGDPQQIYIKYLKADCLFRLKEFDEAKQEIEETMQIIEALYADERNTKDEEVIVQYYLALIQILAKIYQRENDLNSEEGLYRRLFKQRQIFTNTPEASRIRYRLSEIALASSRRGEYVQHLKLVVEAYSLTNSSNVKIRDILIQATFKLLKEGQIESATDGLKKYVETIKIIEDDQIDFEELIKALDEVASEHFRGREHLVAAYFFEESVNLKIKKYGVKDERVAFGHLACGKTLLLAEEYDRAYQRFQSGVNILGILQGKNSLYCANAYKEMGKIKHLRKDYAAAIKDYDTSLEIYIKIFGTSHQFCQIILLNLVELTFITQDITKVTAYTERLTKLLDSYPSLDTLVLYNELGNVFRNNGCPEDALKFYHKALEAGAKVESSQVELQQERIVLVCCNIASSSMLLRKYSESLHFYRDASKYYERTNGGVNENIAHLYCNIAKVYKLMKKGAEAGTYLKRADDVITRLHKAGKEVNAKLDQELKTVKRMTS